MVERLIIDITKQIGNFRLGVRLTIGPEIVVLFGPSGAGKTQTLNMIAGLVSPDRGEIRLDGIHLYRSVEGAKKIDLPTRLRRTAMVFQQNALFSHLTARENVGFGVRRGARREGRVDEMLRRMGVEALADRYPRELSGGQQQRIAIARSVAADSRVLLLDEPFSALDRPTRRQLHHELQLLQKETGLIVLYVTHNLDDALEAGERIAVINQGSIEQIGASGELFTSPRSRTTLEILGVPNLIEGVVCDTHIDWGGVRLRLPDLVAGGRAIAVGQRCCGYIPTEDVGLSRVVPENGQVGDYFTGRVVSVKPVGVTRRVRVELANNQSIEALIRKEEKYSIGDLVEVHLPGDRLILVDGLPAPLS